jgi:hypothetical protein
MRKEKKKRSLKDLRKPYEKIREIKGNLANF